MQMRMGMAMGMETYIRAMLGSGATAAEHGSARYMAESHPTEPR